MPVFHDMLSISTVKVGRGRKQSSCPLKSSWKRGHTLYRKTAPTQGPSHTPMKVKMKSLSRVRLFATRWTVAYQAPPCMGFSRQEYWSGVPFPSLGDLPNPGIKPLSPASPTLADGFFPASITCEAPLKGEWNLNNI